MKCRMTKDGLCPVCPEGALCAFGKGLRRACIENPRFSLANDPPRPKPTRFENREARQRMLLAGLDCLPGQGDLFHTDGEEDSKGSE